MKKSFSDKDAEIKIYTKREIANAKQMIPKEGNSLADYSEYAKLFDYELSEPPKSWIPEVNGSLADYPEYAKLFDYELSTPPKSWLFEVNGSFTPDNISKGAGYKAYFKCPNGHSSYPMKISDKTIGQSCAICEKAKRMIPKEGNSLADYPEFAKLFDYELSTSPKGWVLEINGSFIPKNISKGANYKAYFKCPNGHPSYSIIINNKTKGQDCPICAQMIRNAKQMIPTEDNSLADYPEYAKLFDYELSKPPKDWITSINGPFIPDNISAKANYQAFFKCLNGHSSYPMIINTKTNGSGCPICAQMIRNAKLMIPTEGNSLAEKYPKVAEVFDYELSKPPKNWITSINGSFIPNNISAKAGYQAYFKCLNGHSSYPMIIANKTKGCGCPICGDLLIAAKVMIPLKGNSLEEVFPQIAKEFDYELSTPPENWNFDINGEFIPKNINKSAKYYAYFKCLNGHPSYPMKINNKINGCGCPICRTSHGNKLLVHIFEKHHFVAKREFKFSEFKDNMAYDGAIWNECHPLLVALNSKEKLIIPKSITYSPEILIEYDGFQHFEPVDFAGRGIEWAKAEFKKNISRDRYKNKMFVKKGIPLLRIPYIYDPIKDADKIEQLILEFKRTRRVPQKILDFYAQYEFSNYIECVQELEKILAITA